MYAAGKSYQHHGGRIYFSAAKKAYRVYKRRWDKVEATVRVASGAIADMEEGLQLSCAIIEDDSRPVERQQK